MRRWNRTDGKAGQRSRVKSADKEVAALARWGTACRGSGGRGKEHHRGVGPGKRYLRAPRAEPSANAHLIVRACQNRRIETGRGTVRLAVSRRSPSAGSKDGSSVKIPAAPGREARASRTRGPIRAVSCEAAARRSLRSARYDTLTMVDVRETSTPPDGKPIHWRLLDHA